MKNSTGEVVAHLKGAAWRVTIIEGVARHENTTEKSTLEEPKKKKLQKI